MEEGVVPETAVYIICLAGYLDSWWTDWFPNMTLTHDNDEHTTILTGPVPDQAALHGILNQIRDLGLPLLLLTRREEEPDR